MLSILATISTKIMFSATVIISQFEAKVIELVIILIAFSSFCIVIHLKSFISEFCYILVKLAFALVLVIQHDCDTIFLYRIYAKRHILACCGCQNCKLSHIHLVDFTAHVNCHFHTDFL
nr:MAG TPA: hypothetical protein [Bacteriophage sp.]